MKKLTLLLLVVSFSLFAAKVEEFELFSKQMNKSFKTRVVLPDSYDGEKSFPQIYLLHGAGGDYTSWTEKVEDAESYADKYQRIIICPTAGKTSWYNTHNKSENYIITELIPYVDKKYKTKSDRWLTGLSMGGYGAISLGFKYPKLFSAYGGQSPCITPSKWVKNWKVSNSLGKDVKTRKYDLFSDRMLTKMKTDKRPFAIHCGKQDFFYKENQWAMKRMNKYNINFSHKEMDGSHNWSFWSKSLPLQLEYFSKFLKKN